MFIANTKDGTRVTIDEALENAAPDAKYSCPVCGGELKIRAIDSDCRVPHFCHLKRCTDTWEYNKNSMSEWHRNWQEKFPVEYRECPIEHNGDRHRADILINNTVIEFQHSHMSAKEFEERNLFYRKCGYAIVWVLDATGKTKIDAGDLVWARKTSLFSKVNYSESVPNAVYLQHCISNKSDELLLLSELAAKDIKTFSTIQPIKPENFLKQFGLPIDALSIDDIFTRTRDAIKQREKDKKERERAEASAIFNRLLKGNRGSNRFHW